MLDKLLRLSALRLFLIAAAWTLCVVMHNVAYAFFRDHFGQQGDEPFFVLLAVVVIPLYFMTSLVYTGVHSIRHRAANRDHR